MNDFDLFERHYTENFSTALLVFAARQSADFARRLLSLILHKTNCPGAEKAAVESVERDLPIQLDGTPAARFPDICIRGEADGNGLIVLVEAKIGSGEGLDQLRDYRKWLDLQIYPLKKLVTLTRDPLAASTKSDGALLWSELVPLAGEMQTTAASEFERGFWRNFKEHLKAIMYTFDGFSAGFADVRSLMQEVDLLLVSLFRKMGLTKWNSNWRADRAAYWLPERRATVGFWWWKRWGDANGENALVVWKDGKPAGRIVSTFQEVVANANRSKHDGRLGDFLKELSEQVEEAYQAEAAES
jgi:hypothetical protein